MSHGLSGSKPYVGLTFDSIEEAWEMWKAYGKATGFGVRKNYQHKSKVDGIVNRGSYVCCKEGFKRNDKSQANNNQRWDTRT